MFLTEKELKDKFWENYNYSGRALRYEFESPIREGNADLVTVEIFQDRVQFNAFEFKLSDIRKAILQAKENSRSVHKSWIVVPSGKGKAYIRKIHLIPKGNQICRSDHCGGRRPMEDDLQADVQEKH